MMNKTFDRAWDVLHLMRLKDSDPVGWYAKIYEFAVASNLNLIDFYDYLLQTKELPDVLRYKLISVVVPLKGFYGDK